MRLVISKQVVAGSCWQVPISSILCIIRIVPVHYCIYIYGSVLGGAPRSPPTYGTPPVVWVGVVVLLVEVLVVMVIVVLRSSNVGSSTVVGEVQVEVEVQVVAIVLVVLNSSTE